MSKNTKEKVEKAFSEMLLRVGGGYKFSGWLDEKENGKERSVLAELTDVDTAIGLYASDSSNTSHIVGYVGVLDANRNENTLRIQAEIEYFENIGEIWNYIGTNFGVVISSECSSPITKKGNFHKGIEESLEILYKLISRFDKNISQF